MSNKRNAAGVFVLPLWPSIRRKIIKRDGHKCKICSREENLTVHHILPTSLCLHSSEMDYLRSSFNLVTLCEDCHAKLHSRKIIRPEYLKDRAYLAELIKKEKEKNAQKEGVAVLEKAVVKREDPVKREEPKKAPNTIKAKEDVLLDYSFMKESLYEFAVGLCVGYSMVSLVWFVINIIFKI